MNGCDAALPCVLCACLLEQRADKNGKPYFVCDECGTQFFVRGTTGRERLAGLLRHSKTKNSKDSNKALEMEIGYLHGYIEAFYEDEQIIPPGSSRIEDATPFVDWSREVCERVRIELNRNGKKKVRGT